MELSAYLLPAWRSFGISFRAQRLRHFLVGALLVAGDECWAGSRLADLGGDGSEKEPLQAGWVAGPDEEQVRADRTRTAQDLLGRVALGKMPGHGRRTLLSRHSHVVLEVASRVGNELLAMQTRM